MDGTDLPPAAGPASFQPIGALQVPAARSAEPSAWRSFVSMFRPARAVDVPKRRIGSASDGGYVMLDGFDEPSMALSLGVGDDTTWDRHMAELGAVVHQYDHTVDPPANQPPAIRFHQKRIVDMADGVGVTLEEAAAALEAEGGARPAFLKIDIEGDEWAVLDATPDAVLERFDQIVCEYHDFERMADAAWLERASRVMAKLDRIFEIVHVHGNNHRPVLLIEDTVFPWVLEVTHARRGRFRFEPTDERFPTELDHPNHPHRPDFWLGSFAFGTTREDAHRPSDEEPNDAARRVGVIAALAAERAQTEDSLRPLRGYVDSLRERERSLEDQCRALEEEMRGVHARAKQMHADATAAQADAARAYEALSDEFRRSAAARASAEEDVRRSRAAAQEAQDRYAALAEDFEASLRTIATGRAALAESEDRLRSESGLLEEARTEIEQILSDLRVAEQAAHAQATAIAGLQRSVGALADADARARLAEARCAAIESSSSWRMTRPVRAIARRIRRR